MIDLSKEFHPVPKQVRIKDSKLIKDKKHDCEYCLKKKVWTNKHHVRSKGASGDDIEENLIELCGICHRKVHDGAIKKEELLKIIHRRQKKNGKKKSNT